MKSLVDMTHIEIGTIHASTSIYVFRFLNTIDNIKRKDFVLLIPPSIENYIKKNYSEYQYIVFPYTTDLVLKYKRGLSRIIFQAKQYRKIVKASQCNNLFIASDQHLYTCVPTQAKKIIVIHDLKAIKERSILTNIKFYIFYFLLIISSYKTIAISNYTKQDIIRYFGKFISHKIEVIYNSILLSDKIISPQNISENLQYILYVNTLQKYKNIQTLLHAITLIRNFTHKLVIIGKPTPYWTEYALPYIKKNNLSDKIIHLSHVTDEELHWLYKHASLFVSCSTREGFGYTPIEAAICQCPVICTQCESLQETTMNKLEYYNPPYDAKGLSRKITKVLSSPPTLNSLTKISNIFKDKYSPIVQCHKICNIFNERILTN